MAQHRDWYFVHCVCRLFHRTDHGCMLSPNLKSSPRACAFVLSREDAWRAAFEDKNKKAAAHKTPDAGIAGALPPSLTHTLERVFWSYSLVSGETGARIMPAGACTLLCSAAHAAACGVASAKLTELACMLSEQLRLCVWHRIAASWTRCSPISIFIRSSQSTLGD